MIETAAWLDALYSNCTRDDGEIIFVDPSKRKTVSAHRVGSGKALVTAAKAMDGKAGHYVKINLMDADAMRERSKREGKGRFIVGTNAEVKTIVSLHLDCDAGKSSKYHSRSTMLRLLDQMPKRPTLIINSDGDDGGFHAYWILKEPYRIIDEADRERVQGIANRWQARLSKLADSKLDSTADICRVLRVVGQRRQNGKLVNCHSYDPNLAYSLAELTLPEPKKRRVIEGPRWQDSRADDGGSVDAAWKAMTAIPIPPTENDGSNRLMRYAAIAKHYQVAAPDAVNAIDRLMSRNHTTKKWSTDEIKKRLEQAR